MLVLRLVLFRKVLSSQHSDAYIRPGISRGSALGAHSIVRVLDLVAMPSQVNHGSLVAHDMLILLLEPTGAAYRVSVMGLKPASVKGISHR